jgi:hypothetical protein
VFDQYHYSSELVSIGAMSYVAGDGESRSGGEFRFSDCCYVYAVGVEKQGKFCFLLVTELAFQVIIRKL